MRKELGDTSADYFIPIVFDCKNNTPNAELDWNDEVGLLFFLRILSTLNILTFLTGNQQNFD